MSAPKHAKLEKFRQAAVDEKQRAREAQLEAERAQSNVAHAHDTLIEALADDAAPKIKKARAAHQRAEADAKDAADRSRAATLRVERAERERDAYEVDNARALLDELGPRCDEVTDRLDRAARELTEAESAWQAASRQVGEYLARIPNASARADAKSSHPFEEIVRLARQTLNRGDSVESPMPTWHGLRAFEQNERATLLDRLKRQPKRSAEDEQEMARLRRELGTDEVAA